MTVHTETPWVEQFVHTLSALGMPAATEELERLAWELYPDLCTAAPEEVARLEWQDSVRRLQH